MVWQWQSATIPIHPRELVNHPNLVLAVLQGRNNEGTPCSVHVASVYIPTRSHRQERSDTLRALGEKLARIQLTYPIIVAGDFNMGYRELQGWVGLHFF
jgi:endonuclease/exonuclease/phosphatase (EEP) superfamily protein YafD